MDLSWFLPLLGFALITCGTPGPNNMLLTAAGANLGFRASLSTLVAVVSGLNLIMLATEQRDLLPPHDDEWALLKGIEPCKDVIQPWPPEAARMLFLQRFHELYNRRTA